MTDLQNNASDYPKWCTGLAANDTNRRTDDHSQAKDVLDPNSTEPSEADLLSFPPTLRFIFQLLRCLMGKPGCAGVSYILQPQTNSISTDTEGGENKESESSRVFYEGRPPRDPVVLRYLLECLNCLVRVGNALQNILNAAARAAEMAAAAAAAANAPATAPSAMPAPRIPRVGGVTGTAGCTPGSVTANSVASLAIQASFVLYLVEHCLIPT